ncbi:RimL Acetyltransferases, including N-acetylases of ribosomal proteins [Paracoccaceae bacterium]|jgi:RimJ/RimL family protein N-acetyltransferase
MAERQHPSYPDDPRTPVPNWTPRPSCRARTLEGRTVRIEPLDATRHAERLWDAFGGQAINERIRWFGWPILLTSDELIQKLDGFAQNAGWSTTVIVVGGQPVGMASYMREDAANGVVEIGAIAHASALARTIAATEAHYLLMSHAFAHGYRRYEWKCDNANEPSKRAAARLGFTFEGVFRQHSVRHGHNHDTAWFSVLDHEWHELKEGFERWLDPANFDEAGKQRRPLTLSVKKKF